MNQSSQGCILGHFDIRIYTMCVHVACRMFYTVFDTVFYMPVYCMLLAKYRLLYFIRCILLTAYYREKTVNWWKVKMMRR